jgi:hypothetical protein
MELAGGLDQLGRRLADRLEVGRGPPAADELPRAWSSGPAWKRPPSAATLTTVSVEPYPARWRR